jgi:ribosomal protein S18 acetylase RimI-like enzyme
VGILSNFLGLRDARARSRQPEPPAVIRPAEPAEVDAALRLVLSGQSGGGSVGDEQVQDFIAFSNERGIDLGLLWIAANGDDGQLTHAALPVISPGRTMLLFASPPVSSCDPAEPTVSRLIDAVCVAAAPRGVDLAQALVDPADEPLLRVYAGARFESMAELIYLQGAPHDGTPPPLPPNFHWLAYSPEAHAQFADTILATYRDSLDCPALNGLRCIDDVIDGHKASGIFDPAHWLLLVEAQRPVGVLLLASSGRDQGLMELVYLGLSPESRGRRLAELLVKQAFAIALASKHPRISLAVDAKNVPALKLYYRHGMNRIASKIALMRDLRTSPPGRSG